MIVGCCTLLTTAFATAQAAAAVANEDLQPRTQACCSGTASAPVCEDLPAKDCREAGDKPGGRGTSCDDADFECFEKPCCLPDDACEMMAEDTCVAAQGTVQRGRNCSRVDCAAPPRGAQACCIDNVCSDLTRSDCTAQNGDPQGFGTVCSDTFECQATGITQACCIDDVCSDLSRSDCTAQNGDTQGFGTACDDVDFECSGSTGFTQACCTDGVCSDLSRADCTAQGGDPQGFQSSCTPDTDCGTTTGRTVACCTNALCEDLTSAECTDGGGTSQGFGSACDKTIDCAGGGPTGEVCCQSDGTCDATARPFACRRNGGTMTPGDSCDPNPCGP